MGFRFAAIATSDKFTKDNIDSLSIRFFCNKLKLEKEVVFEEAMSLNYDDDYLDILFLDNGTLIFGSSYDVLGNLNIRKNSFRNKVAGVAVDETSMTFIVDYFENLESKIELFQHNEKQQVKKADDFVISFSDGFGLTTTLIQNITGQGFYSFPADQRLYRYKFTDDTPIFSEDDKLWLTIYVMKTKDTAIMNKLNPPKVSKQKQVIPSNKKWWQFWR